MPQRYPSIHFERLPVFPLKLKRVMRHVKDPDISVDSLNGLLSQDRALMGDLLAAANHPFFRPRGPIRSLGQAIASMGRAGFHDLLFTAAVWSLFREAAPCLESTALRGHSLGCGALCRELARRLRVVEPGLAYRAGLVHDIGLLVLGTGPRDAYLRAAQRAEQQKVPLWVVEESMLGTNHTRLGVHYGERLDLPRPLLEAIRYHHQPETAPEPRHLPALVGFADLLARTAGLGYGEPERLPSPSDLLRLPSWRILSEARPDLILEDPSVHAGAVLGQLTGVSEAARELFVEGQPAPMEPAVERSRELAVDS
jgi:HD-like signal output (HDOD) protein